LRLATTILCLALLSGCAGLTPQPSTSQDAEKLLLDGIHALSKNKAPNLLKSLVKSHPETPQARAASQLLKTFNKQRQVPGTAELETLRKENLQLKNDLEKLRQLLIKSEKRAS